MTDYSTVRVASSPRSRRGSDMIRPTRGRSPKDGGGHASMMSSNINLLNTIIGAGTLAMPLAMMHFGIILGVALIVWCGMTSAFGLYLQARCARYLDRGTSSFFALSQITYPNAAVIFDAAIAIKCFGVGVSYMIIIGDLMPGVIEGFNRAAANVPFLLDRQFWITAFMLVIIPLAFLRRLDSLKYTSVAALMSIGYLIVLVVYHYAVDSHEDRGNVRVFCWDSPASALGSLPVIIFAYTCHQNMFSIVNEIKDNSPASIAGVISASIGSAASVYILVAVAGYLTFGNYVVGNIISMYGASIAATIGKAAIVILVTFSVPLQIHPCRASLDAVLRWRPNRSRLSGSQPLLPSLNPISATLDSHGYPTAPISDMRFALLTTLVLILGYITALGVSSLDRVLAYVGSTGSTSISFILPGLFYYKISDPDSIHHQRLTKEDDDMEVAVETTGSEVEGEDAALAASMYSIASGVSGMSATGARHGTWSVISRWRGWRRRWRWDMEHLETELLRKMALGLSIYGIIIMCVSLIANTFFRTVAAH